MRTRSLYIAATLLASTSAFLQADPCGMVPPIYIEGSGAIVRTGDQQTYVFYQDGVETFVIRPGFSGKVEDFGMLISFPSPPALRKVPEDIFRHVQNAVDPPEVVIDLRYERFAKNRANFFGYAENKKSNGGLQVRKLAEDEVRVLKEEAVGMYEVAVLEAGSAKALKRWMDDHGYKYPKGMDAACNEYVELGWCFVAERAKVGNKSRLDPKPDMKEVETNLPSGEAFDGHVQAMAFRFESKELILPMRLSAFNEGDLHNVIYLLTDGPRKVRSIPEEYVVRQVSGLDLFKNVTEPLPLRIIGGTEADIPEWQLTGLPQQRDPALHNGEAKELFASDLLAVKAGRLSHPFEESEKQLLRIGEHFGLRGPEIDKQNLDSLSQERQKATAEAVAELKKMTLTVIDGDFPREVVAGQNMAFGEYQMPARRNKAEFYDAKTKQPGGKLEGLLKLGELSPQTEPKKVGHIGRGPWHAVAFVGVGLALALTGLLAVGRRAKRNDGMTE